MKKTIRLMMSRLVAKMAILVAPLAAARVDLLSGTREQTVEHLDGMLLAHVVVELESSLPNFP